MHLKTLDMIIIIFCIPGYIAVLNYIICFLISYYSIPLYGLCVTLYDTVNIVLLILLLYTALYFHYSSVHTEHKYLFYIILV